MVRIFRNTLATPLASMEKLCLFILVFCLLQNYVSGQSLFASSCPSPAPMTNFNITEFAGRWYEVEGTLAVFETIWHCPSTSIAITGDGLEIERGAYATLFGRNYYHRILRTKLSVPDDRRPGRMEFSMPGLSEQLKYIIMDTDYDTYALVWSCYESSRLGGALGHFEYVWMLSRDKTMPKDIQQKLYTELDDVGIRRFYLTKNRMENCPKEQ